MKFSGDAGPDILSQPTLLYRIVVWIKEGLGKLLLNPLDNSQHKKMEYH